MYSRSWRVQYENFNYVPCISGTRRVIGCHTGRGDALAFQDHSDLEGWRVFLCGAPEMVSEGKRTAYLQGADLADILAGPFEFKKAG